MQRVDWHCGWVVVTPRPLGEEPAVGVLSRDGDAQPLAAVGAGVAVGDLAAAAHMSNGNSTLEWTE